MKYKDPKVQNAIEAGEFVRPSKRGCWRRKENDKWYNEGGIEFTFPKTSFDLDTWELESECKEFEYKTEISVLSFEDGIIEFGCYGDDQLDEDETRTLYKRMKNYYEGNKTQNN